MSYDVVIEPAFNCLSIAKVPEKKEAKFVIVLVI